MIHILHQGNLLSDTTRTGGEAKDYENPKEDHELILYVLIMLSKLHDRRS